MPTPDSNHPRTESQNGGAGSSPHSSGQVSPYDPSHPVPPASAGLPAVPMTRPPIELVTRPLPSPPSPVSPFVAFWSRPLTIVGVLLLILVMAVVTTWALARSAPATAPGAVGPTSASPSPTPSPAPSISVDPSLEPPPTPGTQPSGAATGSGPSATPAGGVDPAAGPFAPSDVDPYSSGVVELWVDSRFQLDVGNWTSSLERRDFLFTSGGIVGRGTNQLALLSEGEVRSFATCRGKTAWVSAVDWSQLSAGTYACIKWGSRRGMMRIENLPDLNDDPAEVTVTGIMWQPTVKG